MIYQLCVDAFSLEVEVTHCENIAPAPWSRNSDWDAQGSRELEYNILSAVEHFSKDVKLETDPEFVLLNHEAAITKELWFLIDAECGRAAA